MTNVARRLFEFKSNVDLAKAAFNKRPPAPANCTETYGRGYIWSIASYGAENRTLRKIDKNTWEYLKCCVKEGRRSIGQIV